MSKDCYRDQKCTDIRSGLLLETGSQCESGECFCIDASEFVMTIECDSAADCSPGNVCYDVNLDKVTDACGSTCICTEKDASRMATDGEFEDRCEKQTNLRIHEDLSTATLASDTNSTEKRLICHQASDSVGAQCKNMLHLVPHIVGI